MITTVPDSQGRVIAWIEWRQVAQSGFDKIRGEYVWVNDLWVHPDHRNQGLISQMIDKILYKAPDAQYGYFTRKKYGNRMRIWKREQFMKLCKQLEMA